MNPTVVSVSCSNKHTFSKSNQASIKLIEGVGVAGDAHAGRRVKHRYLANMDATKPNLRQVHLIAAELLEELDTKGFSVSPGELGENITTHGIDLLVLPTGTSMQVGSDAVIEVTALRNPCHQIDNFQKGLLKELLDRDEDGSLIRRAGVMGIVLVGGEVYPGDPIRISLPPEPHQVLEYVW